MEEGLDQEEMEECERKKLVRNFVRALREVHLALERVAEENGEVLVEGTAWDACDAAEKSAECRALAESSETFAACVGKLLTQSARWALASLTVRSASLVLSGKKFSLGRCSEEDVGYAWSVALASAKFVLRLSKPRTPREPAASPDTGFFQGRISVFSKGE